MKPLSLYFHVPFCRSRCGYCNFVSSTTLHRRGAYLDALLDAVRQAPLDGYEAVTLYFGGGTPTLLGAGLLRVLEAVRARMPVAEDAEITLEANPGTIDLPLLQALRRGGFNRISFGLQDCSDEMLRLLGRCHTVEEGEAAVRMAKAAGFLNISVDFMLATPGQTPERARRNAKYALSLSVPHISSYLLKIEPGTPFDHRQMVRECPSEDTAADCYLAFYEELESAGYRHYEISNAALPGYESRHNSAYWLLSDYLGIGASAASCFEGKRFHFPDSIEEFITSKNPWELKINDGEGGDWEEAAMLALRLSSGLTPALCAQYQQDYTALCCKAEPLAREGLLCCDTGHIALTDRGYLLSNSVILALLEGTF